MPELWLLALMLVVPLVLFIGVYLQTRRYVATSADSIHTAWLAFSSCLGNGARGRFSHITINPRNALFDRNYLRTVTSNGQGTWNQIEMDDMLGESPRSSIDSNHR